jgi:tRNA A-37 threonylcarbamoyl transferase component Bud32
MLSAVGKLVHRFHAAGYIHRDLHWGNILITKSGPVLLDLQSALPTTIAFARRRDLGDLDYSVAPRLPISDRTRLRAAALGIEGPFGPAERRALRSIGEASLASGRAHAASRTRRTLRPGRQYAPIRLGLDRGFRRREVSEREVAIALAARDAAVGDAGCQILKSDARAQVTAVSASSLSWIVKDYRAGGWLRRVADLFRGSPARRAWLGGHGLLARGIGTALPVAFVERRRFGIPVASAIVLEDLQGLETAESCATDRTDEREILTAVSRLAIGLHRRGAIHGDLKASHVLLEREANRVNGRLIDLEGVRFRRRLSDRARIHALAQLNASLPDHISDAERLRAFRRYAAAVPFRGDPQRCLREIVALSIARQHHWTGKGCALAQSRPTAPASSGVSER